MSKNNGLADELDSDSQFSAEPDAAAKSTLDLLQSKYNMQDLGDPDTLCNTILQYVAEEKYDQATKRLREFQKIKNEFPQFESRSARLFDHSVELVSAIRSKKKFPSMASLPTSKQQELEDILRTHFNDLKRTLKRIGAVDHDLRLQDARSTVWVLQTFVVCVSILLVFALVREALYTMALPSKSL